MNAVVDTTILIDYLNGIPQASEELDRYERVTISIISWIEVMAGVTASDEAEARAFLSTLHVYVVNTDIAERAAKLRQTSRVRVPDAIIYATAQQVGELFVTRNTKDFSATNPDVRVPYTV